MFNQQLLHSVFTHHLVRKYYKHGEYKSAVADAIPRICYRGDDEWLSTYQQYDTTWIAACLLIVKPSFWPRLADQYSSTYQSQFDAESNSIKKVNAARTAANVFLRQTVVNIAKNGGLTIFTEPHSNLQLSLTVNIFPELISSLNKVGIELYYAMCKQESSYKNVRKWNSAAYFACYKFIYDTYAPSPKPDKTVATRLNDILPKLLGS